MPETSTHLLLPYILAAQAQKHVAVNEALRLLDGLVQLAVLDRHLTAPPASPDDGARYIVASGAVGAWAGWDLNVAYRVDGAWMRLVPRPGWLAWVVDEASFLAWDGSAWNAAGLPAFFSDAVFQLAHEGDPTQRAIFDLAAIAAGATRTFALPDVSTELAGLSGAQTFDGDKTFSGELEATGPVATIGTASGTATYGVGTGATAAGATKTVNIGAGGAGGSDTVVNIGSDTPGADGATVINTPTVTFANGVTVVGMPQANLTALLLGLGGAIADAWNRLSVNTPAVLLNNAGSSIEATVNKAATGNDAAFAFKTGFSARALIGLLGSDDFSFKVSPDGSAYHDAILIDRTSGRVELPKPAILPAVSSAPAAPASGKLALYARTRAGQPWLDAMRPTGREFSLQPHLGLARPANWLPSSGATVTTEGMSNSTVGTVSTPGLAATSLATSMRRWRLTSAAVVDSAADQRSGVFACWRGNAAGLGGWTFVTRISLSTLQATGMAFFGLYGSTAAFATTLALSAVVSCIGIGSQRGTHTRWQLVTNDASGAPTLVDMGASFAIATGGVLTLTIAASPNAGSIWVRVVDEVSGAVFEQEVTADLPAANQFLAPRLFMNNGAAAAAVAFDCSGVYVETDY
jgi:flagellin-like hook-associated protein FlgL